MSRIDEYAFVGCTKLKTINIPTTVTEIGNGAFKDCQSLEEVVYEGMTIQWESILKGRGIFFNVPIDKVICSDGEVELNPTDKKPEI